MMDEERELLLLCTMPGGPVPPLTYLQYRNYCARFHGTGTDVPERIRALLGRNGLLESKLSEWRSKGISYVTVLSSDYPERLRAKLGEEVPPVLFLLGDASLLGKRGISLVGSRNLSEDNRIFAERAGAAAARSGLVLYSGDARGADRAAQDACLREGGTVVSFVSDSLLRRKEAGGILYVSELSPEAGFSAIRAHSRNRYIHSMGEAVFVAQTADGSGGSWSGSVKNLRSRWSPLYVFDDGTTGARHLCGEGAVPCIDPERIISEIR